MFGILKKKDKIYKIKLERFNTQLCNYYNLKQNMHKSKEYEKLDSSFEEAFNSFLNRSMYELELEFDKSEYQNNLELYHSNVKENFKINNKTISHIKSLNKLKKNSTDLKIKYMEEKLIYLNTIRRFEEIIKKFSTYSKLRKSFKFIKEKEINLKDYINKTDILYQISKISEVEDFCELIENMEVILSNKKEKFYYILKKKIEKMFDYLMLYNILIDNQEWFGKTYFIEIFEKNNIREIKNINKILSKILNKYYYKKMNLNYIEKSIPIINIKALNSLDSIYF
jgi:hypothetical protein